MKITKIGANKVKKNDKLEEHKVGPSEYEMSFLRSNNQLVSTMSVLHFNLQNNDVDTFKRSYVCAYLSDEFKSDF